MFDSGGSPVSAEFQVNTYTTSAQDDPAVAMNATGEFVVAWSSYRQDASSSSGVFGQVFDSGGSPVGAEFQVNTYTTLHQFRPAVAINQAGGFAVVWGSSLQDGSVQGVFGQMFDSGGSPVGAEFQVNMYTTGAQGGPAVGMNAAGEFVVAWSSYRQDGSSHGIFGQRFDSGGSPVGAEFQVNTYTTSTQIDPAVGIDGAGGFVVAWSNYRQDGSDRDIFGQMFDSGGSPVGSEFRVNTYTANNQVFSTVDINAGGDLVVAWESQHDGSWTGVFAQRGVTYGPSLGSPAPGGTVDCSESALNRPVITWDPGDYDRFRIFMGSSPGFEIGSRVTSGDLKTVTGSWIPSKGKWKSACNKALTQAADPNNASMYIAVEGEDRDLSRKDPLRYLRSFPVRTLVQR
jgi:hypothetical protein